MGVTATRQGGHRLPLIISKTTMRPNIKATDTANPHRRQHQRPDPGRQAGKPASTTPRGNTSEAHNPTAVNTTRSDTQTISTATPNASALFFSANRDPGFTNVRIVDCTLRDLVPDVGGY